MCIWLWAWITDLDWDCFTKISRQGKKLPIYTLYLLIRQCVEIKVLGGDLNNLDFSKISFQCNEETGSVCRSSAACASSKNRPNFAGGIDCIGREGELIRHNFGYLSSACPKNDQIIYLNNLKWYIVHQNHQFLSIRENFTYSWYTMRMMLQKSLLVWIIITRRILSSTESRNK